MNFNSDCEDKVDVVRTNNDYTSDSVYSAEIAKPTDVSQCVDPIAEITRRTSNILQSSERQQEISDCKLISRSTEKVQPIQTNVVDSIQSDLTTNVKKEYVYRDEKSEDSEVEVLSEPESNIADYSGNGKVSDEQKFINPDCLADTRVEAQTATEKIHDAITLQVQRYNSSISEITQPCEKLEKNEFKHYYYKGSLSDDSDVEVLYETEWNSRVSADTWDNINSPHLQKQGLACLETVHKKLLPTPAFPIQTDDLEDGGKRSDVESGNCSKDSEIEIISKSELSIRSEGSEFGNASGYLKRKPTGSLLSDSTKRSKSEDFLNSRSD
ncbi:uncharacterized protein LOC106663333 [Cimex lectularius]|uniref:Uncharacterized protein n=1 Tax=Cimex lectularius TaxID=79782 RepID=A0A8I6RE44_CIMLE|nr:uncharacterized protein LOC106663333 [Cimex lectularius]